MQNLEACHTLGTPHPGQVRQGRGTKVEDPLKSLWRPSFLGWCFLDQECHMESFSKLTSGYSDSWSVYYKKVQESTLLRTIVYKAEKEEIQRICVESKRIYKYVMV